MTKRNLSANSERQFDSEQEAKKKKPRITQMIIRSITFIIVLAAMGLGIQGCSSPESTGEFAPSMGRDHISVGDAHAPYNTDPPTSGPHADGVKTGFYETPIADENIVHNLEHGHVAISYDCDQLKDCDSVKVKLRNIIDKYDKKQVIAIPRQNRDAPIALTSWLWIDLLDEYDEKRITTFIENRRGHAPENLP